MTRRERPDVPGPAPRSGRDATFTLLAIVLLPLIAADAAGRERPWFRYENAYFEVYSDAPEKQVRNLLAELEDFRAAVAQILLVKLPPGAAKTQVVLFRSEKDFKGLAPTETSSAFTIGVQGVPYVVMPAGRLDAEAKAYVRHEYTHVLMGYSPRRVPAWYREGFAEFMAGTNFQDDGTRFTLGEWPGRQRAPGDLLPWNELVSDDFEPHEITDPVDASNAYLQCWLLVHFLSLGEQLEHYNELTTYLDRYAGGTASIPAFESAFEATPDEIGARIMQDYIRSAPYYVIDFKPGIQDHEFVRIEADPERIRAMVGDIRDARERLRGEPDR